MNIKKIDVDSIKYRGNGWPGLMQITSKNQLTEEKPLSEYWGNSFGLYFFTPKRCFSCIDGLCELADISFGDAWLPEFSNEINGKSIVVSRTEVSNGLLKQLEYKNLIELEKVSINKVIESQMEMLYLKKINLNLAPKLFKKVPQYDINPLNSDFFDHLIFLFLYINFKLSSNSMLRNILIILPQKSIKFYGLVYNILLFNKAKKYHNKHLIR